MTTSVVIPSYNRADLLPQTLDSVLAQARPPDEVVVVDDGSTDDTGAVVAAYVAAGGGRVRCHRQENAGLSGARNAGLALSSGEAVLMLDSDDLLRPDALERLGAALEADPDAAVAYCRSELMDWGGRPLGPWTPTEGEADGPAWAALLRGNFIRSSGAALIRRAALDRVGPWDTALPKNEDWDMWLRLAEVGTFARVPEPLFRYRVHAASMSQNLDGMNRTAWQVYRKHRRRHRADPARAAALDAAMREARAARPLYLLVLARLDLRQGRPLAAAAKAAQALLLRPQFLVDPRLARHLRREAPCPK